VQYAEQLLRSIQNSTKEYVAGRAVGVLFSGGLDSTIIARVASEYGPVSLYTIGIEGAHDLIMGEKTAAELELPFNPIVLDEKAIIANLVPLSKLLMDSSPLPLSYEMPLFVVASLSKETVLLSGQGADELFGGYSRYLLMDSDQLAKGMKRDLENLLLRGVDNEQRIASHFQKTIHHPYLHPDVIREATLLPTDQCVDGQSRKVVLREVARLLGLDKVADRPKKAAQYGSGIMRVMKAEAKRLGVGLKELIPALEENEKRALLP
jgi:asparagine synthase (glutamine-hydrolysing)